MSMQVLLVDDDPSFRRQLADRLSAFGHSVLTADDGPTALSMVGRMAFDSVILGWRIPGLDGIGIVRQLREAGMIVPVLMLSALDGVAGKVDCFEAGADDYVVRPVDPRELNARLHALVRARGVRAQPGDTISAGDIVISPSRLQAWRGGRPLALSRTEFGLLLELARNAGSVVTRPMIIERLWGKDFVPTANSVDVHIRHLRRKLCELGDDPISTQRGMGYCLRP